MRCFRAALVVVASLGGEAAPPAEPVPLADFFRRPAVTGPVMSPSGRYVAAAMKGGSQGRQRLVVLNLQDWSKSKVLASFADADIQTIHWVNDDRLVFTLTDAQSPYSEQQGQGLFAVDREGKEEARRLINRRESFIVERSSRRELSAYHGLRSVLRDGSDDVVVARVDLDTKNQPTHTTLLRLDTTTGRTRLLTQDGPAHTMFWGLDASGAPRVAVSVFEGRTRLHWKATADAPWTMAREYDTYGRDGAVTPLAVGNNDVLYAVAAGAGNTDTAALVRFDMRSKDAPAQPLVTLNGYDFQGNLVVAPSGDLLGVRYLTDERGTHWFDPGLKAIQEQVDRMLPDTSNQIDCGDCAQPGIVLVTASSDRQPELYLLYDVKAGTLKVMAASRPWVKPSAMAAREMLRFTARDGLSIPVHLTRPARETGPAAMVVLVHGGPFARAREWAWDGPSQFLASRGYVVLEPDFRGSTGFGTKHFRAGWKQWGLAMQDDIADAATWAVRQGYADPKRVCIAGASYGGYATLMGLIRNPDLFRCGVNWVGVTDIDLLYTSDWSDASEMWKRYGMPALVGDREKDSKQLAATSPLKLAAGLTQPLLMAYGGRDRRVPIEHGTRMRDALRPRNLNVEWVVYPDEGHGWMLEANSIDFWTRVESFLGQHIKNAP